MEEVLGGMEGDFGHAVRSCKLDGRSKRKFSAQVKQTIMTFCQTADLQIEYRHTPSEWLNSSVAQELSAGDLEMVLHGGSIEGRQREVMSPVPEKQRVKVFEKAKEIWNGIVTKRFGSLTWGYSITLKRFQLEKPNLNACLNRRKFSRFDVLLIDEAQDMNPAMLDIFLKQTKTPKIFVGDPHQQIYLFRGAVNALDLVEANKVFYLTQSFRFGPEIAYVANCVLEHLKGEGKKTIVGGKKIDKLIYYDMKPEKGGQVAILARKNSTLFSEAIKRLIIQHEQSSTRRTGFFIGGTDHFDDLLQILFLKSGEKQKMTKYKKFASYAALKAFAKNTDDATLIGKINTVEEHGESLPHYVEKLRNLCSGKNMRNADYVFSTIHKAKGLEWDSVVIVDDFDWIGTYYDSSCEHKPWYEVIKYGDEFDLPEDQKNMLYVAVTRARKNLKMTYHLMQILIRTGDDQWRVGVRGGPSMCDEECPGCARCGCCEECDDDFREDYPFYLSKF